MGLHSAVMILPCKHIIPIHGPDDLRKKSIPLLCRVGAVVNHLAALVRYKDPGQFQVIVLTGQVLHLTDSLGDGGTVQNLQVGDLIGSKLAFFRHRILLTPGEEGMTDVRAVEIQNEQHNRRDDHIDHRVTKLCTAIPAEYRSFTFGSNNQRPTLS